MLLQQITDYFIELMQNQSYTKANEFKFQLGPQNNFSQKIVKKVLVTQFLTIESVQFAIQKKCNLIICRYGLIFQQSACINESTQNLLLLLLQNRIMVCIIPQDWDLTSNGPIYHFAHLLNIEFNTYIFDSKSQVIGLALNNNKMESLQATLGQIERNLKLLPLQIIARKNMKNKRYLLCLPDTNPFQIHKHTNNFDCIITHSISPTLIHSAQNSNYSLVYFPFYPILEFSLHKFHNSLALEFPRIEFVFFSTTDLISYNYSVQNH